MARDVLVVHLAGKDACFASCRNDPSLSPLPNGGIFFIRLFALRAIDAADRNGRGPLAGCSLFLSQILVLVTEKIKNPRGR